MTPIELCIEDIGDTDLTTVNYRPKARQRRFRIDADNFKVIAYTEAAGSPPKLYQKEGGSFITTNSLLHHISPDGEVQRTTDLEYEIQDVLPGDGKSVVVTECSIVIVGDAGDIFFRQSFDIITNYSVDSLMCSITVEQGYIEKSEVVSLPDFQFK